MRAAAPGEGRPAGGEHVDERAFADLEPDEVGHQPREPFERDGVGDPQVDGEGPQVRPERRARLETFRRRRLEPRRTARTHPAMQHHARHVRLDLGQLDAVVAFERALFRLRHVTAATRAFLGAHVEGPGRIGMQLPVRPLVRLAFRLARRFARRFASLARRQARIGRRFGRLAELGFEPRQPLLQSRVLSRQRIGPLDQRQDQRVLRRAVQKLEVGWLDHPSLESERARFGNPPQPP
jgi:hypothetical protein